MRGGSGLIARGAHIALVVGWCCLSIQFVERLGAPCLLYARRRRNRTSGSGKRVVRVSSFVWHSVSIVLRIYTRTKNIPELAVAARARVDNPVTRRIGNLE